MKSWILAVLWRIGLAVLIAAIGLGLSIALNNWSIEYTWFTILGFLCVLAAALPFTPGARLGAFRGSRGGPLLGKTAYIEGNAHRRSRSREMSFSITLAIIGAVNIGVPILMYYNR